MTSFSAPCSRCQDLLRQPPVQAESRADLRSKLSVAAGGVVFTTTPKFFPEELGNRHPLLSDRRNIVVIADEAHRSQYDFCQWRRVPRQLFLPESRRLVLPVHLLWLAPLLGCISSVAGDVAELLNRVVGTTTHALVIGEYITGEAAAQAKDTGVAFAAFTPRRTPAQDPGSVC